MQCSKNQKNFSELFTAFPNSTSNFEHSDKKMTLIITFFEMCRLRKTCLDKCVKCPVSEYTSTVNVLKSIRKHFYRLSSSLSRILSWKISLLERCLKS